MKKNQKITKNGYELIGFPMETMNITQGNNGQLSHKGVNALDIAGKDTGIEPTYAPVSMHLVATDSYANGNAVFMESDKKVMFADGTIDYATFMFLHDNYIADIAQVKKFAQGQEFGDEGTAGYATGNHCHFEVAKGKFKHMYDRNGYGTYYLPGSISADKACVIDGTTVKNGAGMAWKKSDQIGGSQPTPTTPAPQPSGKKWTQDCVLRVGDTVKSVSCGIAAIPGTRSAIQGNLVNVPALGGLVPLADVDEAADTRDGKNDDYLANTNARVFYLPKKVIAIDAARDLCKCEGCDYWIKCGPLMALR